MINSRDSIKDVWGTPAPYHGAWSERVDERKTEAAESWIQSACVLCSNGCGLEIGVKEGRIVGVRGRADDHVNRGRLGPKGLHGWEANNSNDRLTTPLILKNGKLERASWDEAMNLSYRQFSREFGRPCDYSGMSYEKLSSVSGIQWPCNEQFPDGCERLYVNGRFNTDADYCEDYGHNLRTGAMRTPERYKANNPKGRAFLHAADYEPPHESPDEDYPFWLTTGRIVYHFHTRTKTGRSRELNQAAPDVFVQVNETDAEGLGLASGDFVRLESRRGVIEAAVRIGGIRAGHVFVPFHYGYWDDDSQSRAANELTITEWDPVSKQPHFKYSAVRITKVDADSEREGFRQVVANAKEAIVEMKDALVGSNEDADSQKHVAEYLGLTKEAEQEIAKAFASVAHHHVDEPDIFETCQYFAQVSRIHAQVVEDFASIYGEASDHEASRVKDSIFQGPRSAGFGLVRDLHDLLVLTTEAHLGWMVLLQTSQALRDKEFIAACTKLAGETDGQRSWLQTRIKQAAPQALLVDI